jgi:nucleosome binding factor SPN SPT16 subunit
MGDITIEKDTFHDRLSGFISHWKSDKRAADGLFNGANSIIIPIGKANDATDNYSKTAAFQLWLLGYEFPATIIALTTDGITFVTTKKKAIYLEPLKGGKVAVDVLVRGKDADANKAHFAKCVDVAKAAGSKVGVIAGEPQTGPFVDEWKPVCDELLATVEEVDITAALSFTALAVKDEKELRLIRDASRASSYVLGTKVVGEITKIIDDGRKIAHDKLAEKIAGVIDDDKFFAKAKISSDFDSSALDWAISPVIQSGGNYDLKFSSPSDEKNLHSGVIIAGLGLRYNTYASFLARTYMVDPDKSQESNYKLLLAVHNAVVKNIRDGVAAKDVYNKALAQVKAKDEELASHFVKSVGYAIGIENRDKTLTLSPKCSRTLKDGMTFVVLTGFTDLEKSGGDKLGRTYSMALADTVRVGLGVASNETAVYTNKNASTDLQTVAFFFEQDEPTPKKPAKKDNRIAVAQQSLPSTRLRKERQANHDAENEAQRRENQHMLHERKQKQGLEKYSKKGSGSNGTTEKQIKRFESYKRDDQLPGGIQDMGIVLDKKGNTIVLPILGRPVPFHISTIKNASTTAEGEYTSLRINFLSPGQGVGRKDDLPFEDPTAQFIRSLTFRSAKADRMSNFAAGITDMKKQAIRMEQEKKQLEDVVEQDKIRIGRLFAPFLAVTNRNRPSPECSGSHIPASASGQQENSGHGSDPRERYTVHSRRR